MAGDAGDESNSQSPCTCQQVPAYIIYNRHKYHVEEMSNHNHYYIQSINQKCYYYAEKRIRSLQSLEHVTSREIE